MLTLYRRHTPKCPHGHKGATYDRCDCPIWCDGVHEGRRVRQSLKTRDMRRARNMVGRMENDEGRRRMLVSEAVESFKAAHQDVSAGTKRNHRRILGHFLEFTRRAGRLMVDEITPELIDQFRAARPIQPMTWVKELQMVRHFLRFSHDRGWAPTNPAKLVKLPKVKPKSKDPYTVEQVIRILAACDALGRGPYERSRARAMVLVLRFTALRVSDIATLEKSRVQNGQLLAYTMKTGQPVWLPLPAELVRALEQLPEPKAAAGVSKYFFWSGNGTSRAAIRDVTRTLSKVFKLSGVEGAHAHRFRHTVATEILVAGGTAEDAANILGNSPAVIRRHYAQWSVQRQERIRSLMQSVFGTGTVQAANSTANA